MGMSVGCVTDYWLVLLEPYVRLLGGICERERRGFFLPFLLPWFLYVRCFVSIQRPNVMGLSVWYCTFCVPRFAERAAEEEKEKEKERKERARIDVSMQNLADDSESGSNVPLAGDVDSWRHFFG